MATKCNACGGTYSNTQPDGSRYFHACSPEIIQTPAVLNADGSVKTPAVIAPRPVIRNENLTIDPATQQPTMISAGSGVTNV